MLLLLDWLAAQASFLPFIGFGREYCPVSSQWKPLLISKATSVRRDHLFFFLFWEIFLALTEVLIR